MLTNIVDGWILNPSIKYLPYRAVPMMLGQMESLRRAHNRRNYTYVVPANLLNSIAARGQLNDQIRIAANSYLRGVTFYKFDASFNPLAPTLLSLQITDDATGCQFGSEFIQAQAVYPRPDVSVAGITLSSGTTPCLLTQPRLFIKPGLLAVEIANLDVVSVNVQLALYFSEPCEMVERGSQCP